MSTEQLQPSTPQPSATDSPWFWMMLFSAAGLVVLLVVWPKYSERQRRLELQYHARQEIARRRVEGEPQARESGQEGQTAPPATGELLITLWPIALVLVALLVFSAVMFRRDRRRALCGPSTPTGVP
jgi:hypothetical protein